MKNIIKLLKAKFLGKELAFQRHCGAAILLLGASSLLADDKNESLKTFPSPAPPEAPLVEWDPADWNVPVCSPAVGLGDLEERDGIRPIFFEGPAFNGKPTRIFAWLGVPKHSSGKLPAIVLVHGGGGTAFRDWVKLWTDRGYVALAMDTGGKMPVTMEPGYSPKTAAHDASGPAAVGVFAQALRPLSEQWAYHAVAGIIRANSLLRSLPEVDPNRIGLTGISWGGLLVELAASQDGRFRFVAPVYGSGFLGENSLWQAQDFQNLPVDLVERWISLWDPSQYVARIKMPVLFSNGTNDRHFRLDAWLKTTELSAGPVTLAIKVRMPHGHPPAGDPREVAVFADSILKEGQPLVQVQSCDLKDGVASVTWSGQVPIVSVELAYTMDGGNWVARSWDSIPAKMGKERKAAARLPDGVVAWFFNLRDNRDCFVSTKVTETKR